MSGPEIGGRSSQAAFSSNSQIAKHLQAGFDYLNKVFPARSQALRNRTIIQSFTTLIIKALEQGRAAGHEAGFRAFFEAFLKELARQVELGPSATDNDYIAFQRSVNANVKTGAKTRHEVLLRKLFAFDPGMLDLFAPTAIAESGTSAGIRAKGEAISAMIHDINAAYAAKHGEDLFKATNKTATALSRLSKPATTYPAYQRLVDDLYFVLHEAVGSRLTSAPQSFEDVTLLRTGLQHDVDHGKRSTVRSKNKKIGVAFAKYAGAPSPEGIDPARFALVHGNLLAAVSTDLEKVKQSI